MIITSPGIRWKSSEICGKWSKIFGKSSKTPSPVCLFFFINRTLLVSSKIWISCSRGKNIKFISSRHLVMSSIYFAWFCAGLTPAKIANRNMQQNFSRCPNHFSVLIMFIGFMAYLHMRFHSHLPPFAFSRIVTATRRQRSTVKAHACLSPGRTWAASRRSWDKPGWLS